MTSKALFATTGMFETVTITGVMELKEVTKSRFLVDGTADIHTSYTMTGAKVARYENE